MTLTKCSECKVDTYRQYKNLPQGGGKLICHFVIAYFENLMEFMALFCICSDRPSSPGKPELDFIDKTTLKITWSPPADDGGSPVIAYVLERLDDQHEKWIPEEKVFFYSIFRFCKVENNIHALSTKLL